MRDRGGGVEAGFTLGNARISAWRYDQLLLAVAMQTKWDVAMRYLYLVEEATGAEVGRWQIDRMGATAIMELERKILAKCGEGVVLRDSQFDRKINKGPLA